MSDDDVLAACRGFIESPKISEEDNQDSKFFRQRLAGRKLDEPDADALAVACEAFARFPPTGITAGTRLSAEQVQAAVHLVRGSLVQMDTGEGKTFALMVAALTLLRVHSQVYIVTANPYLAMRDTANTAPFWAALGVSVGVAVPRQFDTTAWPSWDAPVVYTTVESLIFRRMEDDMAVRRDDYYRIRRGAVLIDEVDAILLDQLDSIFQETRYVSGNSKNWDYACKIAPLLNEQHVERDPQDNSLRVRLTAAGQEEVIRLTGSTLDDSQHLGLYRDVELAYTGLHVALEGRDYEVVGDTIVPIDPTSGWRTLTRIPEWVAPLASYRRVSRSMWVQRMHLADGLSILLRFDHFAGASGTVIGEALEYLLIAAMPTVVIPPRNVRYKGMKPELCFSSLDQVEKYLITIVADESNRRPILVVASSSGDAYRLATTLRREAPSGVSVKFASGDDFGEQKLFEEAGRAGVVVVSTRQAGRGVDIKLSEEARQNGGSLLILVGHAVQTRLDRQLLGRVGRGGDPFVAYFYNHPDDGFLNRLANLRALKRLDPDGPIHIPGLRRSIASSQRASRFHQLQEFAFRIATSKSDAEVFDVLRRWRQLSQENFDNWRLAMPFLEELIRAYLSHHVPGIEGDSIPESQARVAAAKVTAICGRPEEASSLELHLTGQDAATARSVLANVLAGSLRDAMDANIAALQQRNEDEEKARMAVLWLQWLSALRRRVDWLARRVDGTTEVNTPAVRASSEVASRKDLMLRESPLRALIREARTAQPPSPAQLDDMSFQTGYDQVSALMIAVLSLRPGHGNVTPELLRSASSAIIRAEEFCGPLAARLPALIGLRVIEDRTPVEIVHESITEVTDLIADSRLRLWFDLSQRQLNAVRFQNAYVAGMQDLRKVCEATLVDQVCRNLILGQDPSSLDQLFAAKEHRVRLPIGPLLDASLASQFGAPPVTSRSLIIRPRSRDELVEYFLKALAANQRRPRPWYRPPTPEEVKPALKAILDESPLATLSSAAGVAEALDRWRRNEARRRLVPWRRHRVDQVVRGFFTYLHGQGLSARLPSGANERTLPLRRRIAARLLTPRMGLAAFFGAITLAIAGGLALIHVHAPMHLPGLIRLIDLSLAAGSFGAGLAIGAPLLAVMGATFIKWLLRGVTNGAEVRPVDRLVLVVIAISAALRIVLFPPMSWLSSAAIVVLLLVAALGLANFVWTFEDISQFNLTAGLAGIFMLAIALPTLIRYQHSVVILLLAASGVLLISVWRLIPVRLRVHSLQWSSSSSDPPRSVLGWRPIATHVDWRTHCYALILASLVGSATSEVAWLTPAVYLLIYLLWARGLARSVTGPDQWTKQLRNANQGYAGTPLRPDLTSGLANLRHRFLLRESVAGTVYVALAAIFGPTVKLFGGPTVQLGLIAGFLGIAGWELALTTAFSFRNIVSLELPSGADSRVPDTLSEGLTSDVRDLFSRFVKRLSIVVVAYLALAKIAEVIHVWELIRHLFDLIPKLF
jgi:hypothetical protein